MSGFTDIHAHFVYGVDDGAKLREEMENILDAAYADGIASLFATPHVTPGVFPFDFDLFTHHLAEARQYCRQKGYPMALYAGAEIMYTPAIERCAAERRLPTLAGSDHILMEFVPDISYAELEAAVERMERAGYTTIIAHVERYDCFFHRNNARKLKEAHDICYQLNSNSLIQGRGLIRDRFIRGWLRDELIDFVASDAHDCKRRPPRMHAAYAVLSRQFDQAYVDRLFGLTQH